jgi:hypothetical protein
VGQAVVVEVPVEVVSEMRIYQAEMAVMVVPPEVEVVEVVQVQIQVQEEMVGQVVEDKCLFILGNKIFIKLKLCQLI